MITFIIISAIVCGGFASHLASEKGYGEVSWFFLGFFFNILALIAIAGLPSLLIDCKRRKALEKKYKELKNDYEVTKEKYSDLIITKKIPEGKELDKVTGYLEKKEDELKKFKKMIEIKYY